jgi:hypothetical protein
LFRSIRIDAWLWLISGFLFSVGLYQQDAAILISSPTPIPLPLERRIDAPILA